MQPSSKDFAHLLARSGGQCSQEGSRGGYGGVLGGCSHGAEAVCGQQLPRSCCIPLLADHAHQPALLLRVILLHLCKCLHQLTPFCCLQACCGPHLHNADLSFHQQAARACPLPPCSFGGKLLTKADPACRTAGLAADHYKSRHAIVSQPMSIAIQY